MDKILFFEALKKNHDTICSAHNNRISGLKKSNVTCISLIFITLCVLIIKILVFNIDASEGKVYTLNQVLIDFLRTPIFMPLAFLSVLRMFFYFGIIYYHSKLTKQCNTYQQVLVKLHESESVNNPSPNHEAKVIPLNIDRNQRETKSFIKKLTQAIMSIFA